jgi:hypothetical protein
MSATDDDSTDDDMDVDHSSTPAPADDVHLSVSTSSLSRGIVARKHREVKEIEVPASLQIKKLPAIFSDTSLKRLALLRQLGELEESAAFFFKHYPHHRDQRVVVRELMKNPKAICQRVMSLIPETFFAHEIEYNDSEIVFELLHVCQCSRDSFVEDVLPLSIFRDPSVAITTMSLLRKRTFHPTFAAFEGAPCARKKSNAPKFVLNPSEYTGELTYIFAGLMRSMEFNKRLLAAVIDQPKQNFLNSPCFRSVWQICFNVVPKRHIEPLFQFDFYAGKVRFCAESDTLLHFAHDNPSFSAFLHSAFREILPLSGGPVQHNAALLYDTANAFDPTLSASLAIDMIASATNIGTIKQALLLSNGNVYLYDILKFCVWVHPTSFFVVLNVFFCVRQRDASDFGEGETSLANFLDYFLAIDRLTCGSWSRLLDSDCAYLPDWYFPHSSSAEEAHGGIGLPDAVAFVTEDWLVYAIYSSKDMPFASAIRSLETDDPAVQPLVDALSTWSSRFVSESIHRFMSNFEDNFKHTHHVRPFWVLHSIEALGSFPVWMRAWFQDHSVADTFLEKNPSTLEAIVEMQAALIGPIRECAHAVEKALQYKNLEVFDVCHEMTQGFQTKIEELYHSKNFEFEAWLKPFVDRMADLDESRYTIGLMGLVAIDATRQREADTEHAMSDVIRAGPLKNLLLGTKLATSAAQALWVLPKWCRTALFEDRAFLLEFVSHGSCSKALPFLPAIVPDGPKLAYDKELIMAAIEARRSYGSKPPTNFFDMYAEPGRVLADPELRAFLLGTKGTMGTAFFNLNAPSKDSDMLLWHVIKHMDDPQDHASDFKLFTFDSRYRRLALNGMPRGCPDALKAPLAAQLEAHAGCGITLEHSAMIKLKDVSAGTGLLSDEISTFLDGLHDRRLDTRLVVSMLTNEELELSVRRNFYMCFVPQLVKDDEHVRMVSICRFGMEDSTSVGDKLIDKILLTVYANRSSRKSSLTKMGFLRSLLIDLKIMLTPAVFAGAIASAPVDLKQRGKSYVSTLDKWKPLADFNACRVSCSEGLGWNNGVRVGPDGLPASMWRGDEAKARALLLGEDIADPRARAKHLFKLLSYVETISSSISLILEPRRRDGRSYPGELYCEKYEGIAVEYRRKPVYEIMHGQQVVTGFDANPSLVTKSGGIDVWTPTSWKETLQAMHDECGLDTFWGVLYAGPGQRAKSLKLKSGTLQSDADWEGVEIKVYKASSLHNEPFDFANRAHDFPELAEKASFFQEVELHGGLGCGVPSSKTEEKIIELHRKSRGRGDGGVVFTSDSRDRLVPYDAYGLATNTMKIVDFLDQVPLQCLNAYQMEVESQVDIDDEDADISSLPTFEQVCAKVAANVAPKAAKPRKAAPKRAVPEASTSAAAGTSATSAKRQKAAMPKRTLSAVDWDSSDEDFDEIDDSDEEELPEGCKDLMSDSDAD